MDTLENAKITKISQVTPGVTWFLRGLGLSDYYIIKIYSVAGDSCVGMTNEDPFWLLDEFSRMGFRTVDGIAKELGIGPEDPRRLKACVRYALASYVAEGHTFAPLNDLRDKCAVYLDISPEMIEDTIETMTYEGILHKVSATDGERVYFYRYFRAENHVASRLTHMADQEARDLKKIVASPLALIRKFEAERGIELSEEQKRAVLSSLTNGVTVITGGPGTGKTTILNAIIFILEESGQKVAVTAPTGRAAKRIMETGGHFAQTVHRLLEYYYDETRKAMVFAKNAEDPLDYDCIIVDESSMMDIMLCDALLDAVKERTRLILVGDKDQLPSVGPGNVLGDIISSDCINTIFLNRIYRQGEESDIITNAHRINHGDHPVFRTEGGSDFEVIKLDSQKDIRERICEIASMFDPETLQVLTPVKKGILGTGELNEELQKVFNPPESDKMELKFGKKVFREGDRVMQIKNDYQLAFKRERHDKYGGDGTQEGYLREDGKGIFNGEIGQIIGIDRDSKSITVAFDDDRFGKTWGRRFALYEYSKLDELEQAFAVTVHKSQGSEYPVVMIPVTWFPPVLATRSLIYTAITRGKNRVILVGNPEYLNAMVDNDRSEQRYSGLKDSMIRIIDRI
ncbi:MAG: ATP-dependent RecD-like DNA helicase [Clostridiales bacterium]|nr:ATP-dependent RecD-like DNA helicase [Clostridiales bacterium]